MKKFLILMIALTAFMSLPSVAFADGNPVLVEVSFCKNAIKSSLKPEGNGKIFVNLKQAQAIIQGTIKERKEGANIKAFSAHDPDNFITKSAIYLLLNHASYCIISDQISIEKVKNFIEEYSD